MVKNRKIYKERNYKYLNMKPEGRKKQIIGKFADVDDNTGIKDVLDIVDEYYKEFPNSCYNDLDHHPYRHKKIYQAIEIHFICNQRNVPLEQAIMRIMGEDIERGLVSGKIEYDRGLNQGVKTKNWSSLVQRVAQAVKKADFVILKAYSSSDFFNPRLFILGYRYEDSEFILSVEPILDIITEQKTVFGVDSKEGWFRGKARPSIEKYAKPDEVYGIDHEKLMKNGNIGHFDAVQRRLYQAIISNLKLMHEEYKDENIVALLQTHLSLYYPTIYRELEKQGIDYIAIFPRTGTWEKGDRYNHRLQLNTLGFDKNEEI